MRWLLLLPVLSLGTACTPVIVERGGPPPAYPAEPPVVYQPMPAPDYPPRDEARRPGRDRDEYQERRVDVIIERAYRDLLERAPRPGGARTLSAADPSGLHRGADARPHP